MIRKGIFTLALMAVAFGGFFAFFDSFKAVRTAFLKSAIVQTDLPQATSPAMSTPPVATPKPSVPPPMKDPLEKDLSFGARGGDVKLLQMFLARDPLLFSEDKITGVFDEATQEAVKKYQAKNNIVSSGRTNETGYGRVGPITRASLNSKYTGKTYGISWVDGKYGTALDISGGYLEVPATKSLDLTFEEDAILEAWVNPTTLTNRKAIIFSRGQDYGLGLQNDGRIFVRQGGVDVVTNRRIVKEGEWQQITAIISKNKITFKYNEKIIETKLHKATYQMRPPFAAGEPLRIGMTVDQTLGLREAYLGKIDNVKIFTVPNSQLEPLPKLRLEMDEGTGSSVTSVTKKYRAEARIPIAGSAEVLKAQPVISEQVIAKLPAVSVSPSVAVSPSVSASEGPTSTDLVTPSPSPTPSPTGQAQAPGSGQQSSTSTPSTTSPPDPNFPMPPHGQAVQLTISSDAAASLKFLTVDINPLVVYPGDTQTLTAKISSTNPVTSVTAVTTLDTSTLTLHLLNDGTGTNTWTTSWVVSDTHVNIYKTTFTATDNVGGSTSTIMAWSDPCTGFTHNTNSTLGANCTVSVVDGVDNGNIIIPAGRTLTLNAGAALVYNNGKTFTKTGTLVLTKGASIRKANLFYPDVDDDGWAASTVTMTWDTASAVTDKVRASTNAGVDCDDGNAALTNNCYSYSYSYAYDYSYAYTYNQGYYYSYAYSYEYGYGYLYSYGYEEGYYYSYDYTYSYDYAYDYSYDYSDIIP